MQISVESTHWLLLKGETISAKHLINRKGDIVIFLAPTCISGMPLKKYQKKENYVLIKTFGIKKKKNALTLFYYLYLI